MIPKKRGVPIASGISPTPSARWPIARGYPRYEIQTSGSINGFRPSCSMAIQAANCHVGNMKTIFTCLYHAYRIAGNANCGIRDADSTSPNVSQKCASSGLRFHRRWNSRRMILCCWAISLLRQWRIPRTIERQV